jgi:hypothetical protein
MLRGLSAPSKAAGLRNAVIAGFAVNDMSRLLGK